MTENNIHANIMVSNEIDQFKSWDINIVIIITQHLKQRLLLLDITENKMWLINTLCEIYKTSCTSKNTRLTFATCGM